jgi:uncharacterized protein DUF3574
MQRYTRTWSFAVVVYAWVCLLAPGGWTIVRAQAEPAAVQAEQASSPAFVGERFIRTELYFGSLKPNKTHVTDAEFQAFLQDVITPRFPEGLTLLTGRGQFLDASDEIVRERSRVLILLYPVAVQQEKSEKIEEIREAYKRCFQQESVLRTDRCCERVGF